jgi:uncharacterized protein (TIGR03086 family)
MTEIADRYRRLSDRFAERIAAVGSDQWDRPTPCDDWSARQLVEHVVASQGMFLGFIGREAPPPLPVAEDAVKAWDAARSEIQGALDDPEVATQEFDGYFGRSTFEAAVDRFLNFDLVVHGWDLARATGQDERIDPDDLRRIDEGARAFGDAMRGPGAFGPAVEPPEGADEQQRVLAVLGRRP